MLFLWLNKTPPKWDPPLSVQESFVISFLEYYFLPLLNTIGYQLINTSWKTLSFEIGGGAVLLLWAHFSPFLAWIAKNGTIRALELWPSPLVINKWVKIIPKTKSFCSLSQRWRVSWSDGEGWVTEWKPLSSPKTPIPFQYTYDLVWDRLENTLVIAYKRDMIKGI